MRMFIACFTLVFLTGCDFIGGAETLVRGSNNFISRDGDADTVAYALSRLEGTPAVTDEELVDIYANIRGRALAGDLDAARVMLQLAAIQRTPDPEEDEEE